VHCKIKGCPCPSYYYIPVHGSQDFKCLCKHSYTEHDPITKKCTKGRCGCNVRFASSWACSCHLKFSEHHTVFETKDERIANGKSVDDMGDFDAPMGMGNGLGNFSASMVSGVDSFCYQAQQMALDGPQYPGQRMLTGPSGKSLTKALPGPAIKQVHFEESKGKPNRLAQLNQKLNVEKKINAIENGDALRRGGGDYDEDEADGADEEITALQLFNTPHGFAKSKVSLNMGRRQIKY